MDIISLLANDNYIVVNRDLIKEYGINTALLLGELASEYNYYRKQGQLVDGMFYSTIENIQDNTGLSRHQQTKALEQLKECGLIEVVLKGLPAKRFIKLDIEALTNKIVKNSQTCSTEINKLDSEKVTTNNNNNNSNNETVITNNKEGVKPSQIEKEFNIIWEAYPRKQGKANAFKAYEKARKKGVAYQTILDGVYSYITYIRVNKVEDRFIKQGSTWFNQQCWNDEYKSGSAPIERDEELDAIF